MTSYTYGGAHAIPAVDDEARRFVPSRGGMGVGGEGSGRGGCGGGVGGRGGGGVGGGEVDGGSSPWTTSTSSVCTLNPKPETLNPKP
jgi:hypothetical protein